MKITIIKKDRLNSFLISNNKEGSFWLTDFEHGKKINLLSVEVNNGNLEINSNSDVYIIDDKDTMVPKVTLKNYSFYIIKNNIKDEKNYIYCEPEIDETFKEYAINKNIINIGSNEDSDICFTFKGIPDRIITISKEENNYYIEPINSSNIYLNQKLLNNKKKLSYGDNVFVFGLKLILMRKSGIDYLLVNNPDGMVKQSVEFTNITHDKSDYVEKFEELSDESVNLNDDYFYRTPYFYKTSKTMEINIDTPPQKKEENEQSAILTIGPMITMSMTSVIMLVSNFSNGSVQNGNITPIITAGAMLASSLLWPTLTRIYQKRADKKYEKKRQKQYKKYIDKIDNDINIELNNQREMLLNNNFRTNECIKNIKEHNTKLWQRRVDDEDFLTLPVGYGNIPMDIKINYPEERFSLEEDNLLDIARELGKKERILNDVPIRYSFFENIATGIVGNRLINKELVDRVILQIMAQYSYDEVKLVTLTSINREDEWEYMKVLPHSWSDDKQIRYFGSSNDDYREIIYNLEMIYSARKQRTTGEKDNTPHYVIVTDATKSIDTYDFIKNIMKDGKEYGFSIIMLVDKLTALPNECKNFIEVTNEECSIFRNELSDEKQTFKIDNDSIYELYNCAKEIANIKVDIKFVNEEALPSIYHFLEMYQVGKVEQLNSGERWRKSNPILSLQTPVGIGKSGEIINLDLHEKYHGPHGLIAGTTGSGKSEFIISYVLSLAVNYSPYEVQVVLIDYKGGSLAGAFSNDQSVLPHLVGTMTNLDGGELNRSLASIESEVKRRQKEFNDARNLASESNIDIYKYQKLWREGRLPGKDPIAHLFIISDEFAELKEQQPDFMEKLISVARVGRSLGIHLILATQKPGGVVDSQIWSNSRFKVCLKVQDVSDSQEVIKKPDAAYLKKTGRFYLQVGYDEVFTLGQSSWAGGQYYPSASYKKETDTTVNEINNIGFVLTSKESKKQEVIESQGEELPNIVKYLQNLAEEQNIEVKKLWLDKIPDKIYIDNLKNKYNFVKTPYVINPIIGEYDDPDRQRQSVLTVPLSSIGNLLVFGISGSGKEEFVTSLIYSTEVSYTPEEVNFYIFDFASESLRMFRNSPFVADITYISDTEKINNFFKFISEEIDHRKELFADYGGKYSTYIEESNNKIPNYVVIINGYENFEENYIDLIEEFQRISRDATKYGIYFVITATSDNGVRSKVRQNFPLQYVLEQASEYDYASILGNIHGKIPSKILGRGLFKKDKIFEFQTAMVTDDNTSKYINEHSKSLQDMYKFKLNRIPVLPSIVDFDFIKNSIETDSKYIIGVNKDNLNIEAFDFKKSSITLISSLELEFTSNFVRSLIKETELNKYYTPLVLNGSDESFEEFLDSNKIINKQHDTMINKLIEYIDKSYEQFEKYDFNDSIFEKSQKIMCICYGVGSIINKINQETKDKLAEVFKKNNEMGLIAFLFVDNVEVLKNYAYEDWFRIGCDQTRGIWIGSGVSEQNVINISRLEQEHRKDISNSFGFVVNNSRISSIKLLNGMQKLNIDDEDDIIN